MLKTSIFIGTNYLFTLLKTDYIKKIFFINYNKNYVNLNKIMKNC